MKFVVHGPMTIEIEAMDMNDAEAKAMQLEGMDISPSDADDSLGKIIDFEPHIIARKKE